MSHAKRRNHNRNLQRKLLVENLNKRELFAVDATTFESSTPSELTNIQNSSIVSTLSSSIASAISIDKIERQPSVQGRFDFRISGTAPSNSVVRVEQLNRGILATVNANVLGKWSAEVSNVVLVDRSYSFQANATVGSPGTVVSSDIKKFQPNILLVQVDDMRTDELDGIPWFANKVTLEGAKFQNSFVPTALCGPSRASLITGLLPDNTGIFGNSAPLGGGVNLDLRETLATLLNDAGYRTGLFGKDRTLPSDDRLLPSQDIMNAPPGWDDYFASITTNNYNFTMTDNGQLRKFDFAPENYFSDVVSNRLLQFISARPTNSEPFFALATPIAPHSPYVPAQRHMGTLPAQRVPRTDAFNLPELGKSTLDDVTIRNLDRTYKLRKEMLLSVDELIQSAMSELQVRGELDNTMVIFTSDNGFLLGEHGLIGKQQFYEESIRVPLMILDGRQRVPSIHHELVLNVDVAPTLVQATNAATKSFDGASLIPLLENTSTSWRSDFLIKHFRPQDSSNDFLSEVSVRNQQWSYAERSNGSEYLFDLSVDPYQANNLAGDSRFSDVQAMMNKRLAELKGPDSSGPEIAIRKIGVANSNVFVPAKIRIEVDVDDRNHGNSTVRSPELYLGQAVDFGSSIPLDAADGLFDSPSELAVVDIPLANLVISDRKAQVSVRGRDVKGNWGIENVSSIQFDSNINLSDASDTGDSINDGVTIDSTPTFNGTAPPGSTVVLFYSVESAEDTIDAPTLLGSSVANALGRWSITSPALPARQYLVSGQYQTPGNSAIRFLIPEKIHLLASINAGKVLLVNGTWQSESILVRAENDYVDLFVNSVRAGRVPTSSSIEVSGLSGDDTITVVGTIPSKLTGGEGNDVLNGGSGPDIIDGGNGDNILAGGLGNDSYLFPLGGLDQRRASTRRDNIRELPNEGIDQLNFRGSTRIIANLTPIKSNSQITIRSAYVLDRFIDLELTDLQTNIETLIGTDAEDELTIGPGIRVKGAGGNDKITIAAPHNSAVPISQVALAIDSTQVAPVKAIVKANLGVLRIDSTVTTGVAGLTFSGHNTDTFEVTGLVANINSWFAAGGLQYVNESSSFAATSLSFQVFDKSTNALIEQDQLQVELTARPELQLGSDLTYTENQGPAAISPDGRLIDADENIAGGIIDVNLDSPVVPADMLLVFHEGNGTNQLSVIHDLIRVNNVLVGKIQPQSVDGHLQIQLTAQATVAHAQAILRRIAFKNDSDNPVSSDRVVQVRMFDGLGIASLTKTKTIKFNLVDDPLDFELPPTQQFQAGTGNILVAGNAVFTDRDTDVASQEIVVSFAGITQLGDTVSLRSTGFNAGEVGIIDRQIFVGNQHIADFSGHGTENSPLVISLNPSATEEHVQAILRAITFNQALNKPFGFDRPIRVSILDRVSQQREERFVIVKVNTGLPNAFTPNSADDSFSRLDITRDTKIQPLDVLRVINELNSRGSGSAQGRETFDVNADGKVTPRDALIIINRLNRLSLETVEAQVLHFDMGIFPTAPKYAVLGIVRESTSLKLALDDHPYQDISSMLQSNEFLITEQHLVAMFGNIGPGQHRLRFFAELDSLLTDLLFEI